MRGRQIQLLEQIEHAPDADPVAVVTPGVIALLLRLALLCRIPARALAIGIDLDIGRDAKGQPLAVGPGIVLALTDDRIFIAIMFGNGQHQVSSVRQGKSMHSPIPCTAQQVHSSTVPTRVWRIGKACLYPTWTRPPDQPHPAPTRAQAPTITG